MFNVLFGVGRKKSRGRWEGGIDREGVWGRGGRCGAVW